MNLNGPYGRHYPITENLWNKNLVLDGGEVIDRFKGLLSVRPRTS